MKGRHCCWGSSLINYCSLLYFGGCSGMCWHKWIHRLYYTWWWMERSIIWLVIPVVVIRVINSGGSMGRWRIAIWCRWTTRLIFGIVVLSTVVPTSFMAVDSLDKTRFRFIVGHLRLSLRGTVKGERVTSCHLIWLLSVKLRIVVLSTVVPTSFMAVWMVGDVLVKLDRGRVDCGTLSFVGVDSFDKTWS